MFKKKPNVHYHSHGNQSSYSSSKIEVVEKKAPTDESVRLLMEMEKKAEDKLLHGWHIDMKDNKLEGAVFIKQKDITSLSTIYLVKFNLNGVPHKVEVRVGYDEEENYGPEHVLLIALRQELEKTLFYYYLDALKSNKIF